MKFEKFIYKKKIKDLPEDLLPREKALKNGISSLSDSELLAISLGTGTKGLNVIGLSDLVIKKFGLKGLLQVSLEDLTKIKGIGKSKALQILAVAELAKRMTAEEEKIQLNSPQDVYNLVKELRTSPQEKMVCLYTNTLNELLHKETVAIGNLNVLNVSPRDIFFYAIRENAYGIILVHNHPNGKAIPSEEDISFTKEIKDLAIKLGFEVLDHIIVSKDGYYSFAENEIL